ncbi:MULTISPECIES: hypothetical protein [Actinomycetes]|uniref:hypothetical protein n=1 Tax=Actinomycetes TaxID=1760 RepID=UPI00341324F5
MGMSVMMRIAMAAVLAVGAVALGAFGAGVASWIAAGAAVAIGTVATARVSRGPNSAGFFVGIVACTATLIAVLAVSTAAMPVPALVAAQFAALLVVLWVALAIVHSRNRRTDALG